MKNLEELTMHNLRISIDALKEANIPPEKIFMQRFGGIENKKLEQVMLNQCNSVACVLGHIATLPIWRKIVLDPTMYTFGLFDHAKFSKKIFPSIHPASKERGKWNFLFSGAWGEYQGTLELFYERAEIVLSGKYKEGWIYRETNKFY